MIPAFCLGLQTVMTPGWKLPNIVHLPVLLDALLSAEERAAEEASLC